MARSSTLGAKHHLMKSVVPVDRKMNSCDWKEEIKGV